MNSRYLLNRSLTTLLVVFVVLTIMFLIFRLLPTDPTALFAADSRITPADQKTLENLWGLSAPLYQQYWTYLHNLLTGQWGLSFYYGAPVWDVLGRPLLNSLLLLVPALCIAFVLSLLVGPLIGWKRGSKGEKAAVSMFSTIFAIPQFWLGILLLMFFSYYLHLLPSNGAWYPGAPQNYLSTDFLRHLVLPLVTATLWFTSNFMLLMRNQIVSLKEEEHIRFLGLRGLRQSVQQKHAMRNALVVMVTWFSQNLGFAFGGQVAIEIAFSWPGIGERLVQGVLTADYPVVQAGFFVVAVMIILGNLTSDFLYQFLDPRIKFE